MKGKSIENPLVNMVLKWFFLVETSFHASSFENGWIKFQFGIVPIYDNNNLWNLDVVDDHHYLTQLQWIIITRASSCLVVACKHSPYSIVDMKTMAYYQVCNTATETIVVERQFIQEFKACNLESVICLYVNISWEAAANCNKKMAHIVCGIFC
jgi:hypothetical protein